MVSAGGVEVVMRGRRKMRLDVPSREVSDLVRARRGFWAWWELRSELGVVQGLKVVRARKMRRMEVHDLGGVKSVTVGA